MVDDRHHSGAPATTGRDTVDRSVSATGTRSDRHGAAVGGICIGPLSRVSKSSQSQRTRERDLPVTAEAIMTSTAATTIAMSHRTQSMPALPLPPNAV